MASLAPLLPLPMSVIVPTKSQISVLKVSILYKLYIFYVEVVLHVEILYCIVNVREYSFQECIH